MEKINIDDEENANWLHKKKQAKEAEGGSKGRGNSGGGDSGKGKKTRTRARRGQAKGRAKQRGATKQERKDRIQKEQKEKEKPKPGPEPKPVPGPEPKPTPEPKPVPEPSPRPRKTSGKAGKDQRRLTARLLLKAPATGEKVWQIEMPENRTFRFKGDPISADQQTFQEPPFDPIEGFGTIDDMVPFKIVNDDLVNFQVQFYGVHLNGTLDLDRSTHVSVFYKTQSMAHESLGFDPATYDPSELSDDDLKADRALLEKKFEAMREGRETEFVSKTELLGMAAKLILELANRNAKISEAKMTADALMHANLPKMNLQQAQNLAAGKDKAILKHDLIPTSGFYELTNGDKSLGWIKFAQGTIIGSTDFDSISAELGLGAREKDLFNSKPFNWLYRVEEFVPRPASVMMAEAMIVARGSADLSAAEDRLVPFRFAYFQAQTHDTQKTKNLIANLKDSSFPIVAMAHPQGLPVQLHKAGGKFELYGPNGLCLPMASLPQLSEELTALNDGLIAEGILTVVSLNADEIMDYLLAAKLNKDIDRDAILFLTDVLYAGGVDVHGKSRDELLDFLVSVPESRHVMSAQFTVFDDKESLEKELDSLGRVALKPLDAAISLDGKSNPVMIREIEHQAPMKVLALTKTAGGFSYVLAVADMGKQVMVPAAEVANSKVALDVGDVALVSFKSVNKWTDEDQVFYQTESPRLDGKFDGPPAGVEVLDPLVSKEGRKKLPSLYLSLDKSMDQGLNS